MLFLSLVCVLVWLVDDWRNEDVAGLCIVCMFGLMGGIL